MQSFCSSGGAALLGSATNGVLFVACLYIGTNAIPDRDQPKVVKERFLRVGIASALAPAIVIAVLQLPGASGCVRMPATRWFGLWPAQWSAFFLSLVLPLALTMTLFLGPLVMNWVDRDRSVDLFTWLRRETDSPARRLLLTRNLLVGPLAEEWVFRACMCPLMATAGWSDAASVFCSAFFFGGAHSI